MSERHAAGAKVSLHPVASRHGQQSSTLVSVNLPTADIGGRPPMQTPRAVKRASAPPSSPAEPADCSLRAAEPSMRDAGEWGLQHADLDQYLALDHGPPLSEAARESTGIEPPPIPIRLMTASQLYDLHSQYISLDVPHNVVFPFLHGVDGTIAAQNIFFGAPMSGQPTPNYRGLTIVRADMPTPEEEAELRHVERQRGNSLESCTSDGSRDGEEQHVLGIPMPDWRRTSSTLNSHAMYSSYTSSSSDDDAGGAQDNWRWPPSAPGSARSSNGSGGREMLCGRPRAMTSSASSASVTSSTVSGPSLFSSAGTSASSQTSFGSASELFDMDAAVKRRRRSSSAPYEAQPKHSMLNSTVFPSEILSLPVDNRTQRTRTSSGGPTAPRFISPPQAPGVSLRNFKIQCAKYATISDIVVYCPAGFHPGALKLAQWFREAQDALWKDRQERKLGGLRYNVFVVVDAFEAFEQFPELIAIDSCGMQCCKVDFVEREREEMQRLTTASEIDDNVWLGCGGDLPNVPGSECTDDEDDEEPLSPSEGSNPRGFAVCIEAHEMAASPDKTRLQHASHFLDAIEATALFEVDSRHALRKLGEDDDGVWADERTPARCRDGKGGSLVLGPNGWTPVPGAGARNSSLTNASVTQQGAWQMNLASAAHRKVSLEDQDSPLALVPSSVIHLECPSTFMNCTSEQQVVSIIEGILLLCAWIKKQAAPPSVKGGSRSASAVAATHRSRRILLHCADGYTETSLLALSYLMYSRNLSLPEAYLDLQQRANRSFFVYARDLPFLKKVEAAINEDRRIREHLAAQERQRQREADARASRVRHSTSKSLSGWNGEDRFSGFKLSLGRNAGGSRRSSMSSSASDSNLAAQQHLNEPGVWARGLAAATGLVSGSGQGARKSAPSSASSSMLPSRARTPTPKDDSPDPQSPPSAGPPVKADFRWFEDPRFEGSFPSRILPFLYLGNLNHALNAHMLHALGITHVVSVGESAIAPPACDIHGNRISPSQVMSGSLNFSAANSLYHEHAEGRISVLDLKNVSDDGIDPLRDAMRDAVEYIESARRSGGKVLVHCRVGVSRSTTIVLAYVMAHLDLSLVESYLLVRSRRLNILIQPHLLFFWELRGWETFLAEEKLRRAAALLLRSSYRSYFESLDSTRSQQVHSTGLLPDSFASLSVRGGSMQGKSDYSGSYRSAHSSLCTSPLLQQQQQQQHDVSDNVDTDADDYVQGLDVDLAAGAGSVYGFKEPHAELLPFGSGSCSGLPYASMRLLWGHFAREIAELNSRYFV